MPDVYRCYEYHEFFYDCTNAAVQIFKTILLIVDCNTHF